MSVANGRQVAPTIDGIRDDHLARYRFAADMLYGQTVIDAAAGIGYGSCILADRCEHVHSYEIDPEAVAYQRWHYRNPKVTANCADVTKTEFPHVDAAVSFETIEHLRKPELLLKALGEAAGTLIGSVPNQDVLPFDPQRHKYHVRHYTPPQLAELLRSCGWLVENIWFQQGKRGASSAVTAGPVGSTVVFSAVRER